MRKYAHFLARATLWTGITALAGNPLRADMVTRWNGLLLTALRTENAAPTLGSRNAAIVHAAIFDAVNAVVRKYEPYRYSPTAAPGASAEAAALAAAYETLTLLFPSERGIFDNAYAQDLAALPDDPGREEGLRAGREAAELNLNSRASDGASTDVPYIPSDEPGAWRRTPPDYRPPLAPNWGFVEPFVIPSTQNFPIPPPPALDSSAYAEAYDQVASLGSRQSQVRTADQTEIGHFWAYDRGGMGPPPILYNQIVREIAETQGNTLEQNARLFALINLAQADGCIVCWNAKYQYNFWRPITAIQEGDWDGNEATVPAPDWTPLGAPGSTVRPDFTPPFPSYPSGHGTFGGAVFRLLTRFYGTDAISFSSGSDETPNVRRTFPSFSAADEENALSRVYLGVHWIFDQRAGQASGREIAEFIFRSALRPLPPSLEVSVPSRLPDGSYALHVSAPAPAYCSLEASTDLRHWATLVRGLAPFNHVHATAPNACCFYRALTDQPNAPDSARPGPR